MPKRLTFPHLSLPRVPMFRKRHPPVGSRPGTLMISEDSPPPRITLIDYTMDGLTEREIDRVEELRPYLASPSVTWIDVVGLGDERVLRELAALFDLHPLLIEDVVNVPQRPKSEPYDNLHLYVSRMLHMGDEITVRPEQLSIILGRHFLLTFQERAGDVLEPVRTRIRQGKGLLRQAGPDYLAYAILDTVIDSYYPLLEAVGDRLEELETEVIENPTDATIATIYRLKRDLLAIRRAIWPQRDAINSIVRDDHDLFTDQVRVYLRDSYDHCVQVMDVLESYREMAGGLLDVYLSSVNNRMNEVMKVLTVMASIFIPLTFIAGVYGMNFEFMPELHKRYAYPMVWAIMLTVAGGMVWLFVRKGWIRFGRAAGQRGGGVDKNGEAS